MFESVRRSGRIVGCVLLAAALGGCGSDGASDGNGEERGDRSLERALVAAPTPVATPAAAGSGEPNLVVGPESVYLSWLEQTGEGRHALRYARWEDGGWGSARTIIEREDLFVNWADFPAMTVLDDGTLTAHWLEKSGPGTYSYDVRMAISRDGGESWSEDVIPHRDGVEAEHGFVSLHPIDGQVGVTWLDGRETVHGEPMTIRFTTLSPGGDLGEPVLLDSSTCDCCQTDMVVTDRGPLVVYRDRTADEIRDISVVRRIEGEWSQPASVHDDGWRIAACPVNGPSAAAAGSRVAVGWFTGAAAPASESAEGAGSEGSDGAAAGGGRVLVAFSDDAGATFGPPVRVDDGEAMGRVDVVLLDDGSALAVWLERVDGAAEVRARRVGPDAVGPATTVTGTAAERASGFPRIVRDGDRVLFAWTEPGRSPRVRTSVASLGEPEPEAE